MMAVDFESVVTRLADTLTPAGTMLPFAGKTVPSGWLLCNGAAVSRTTYARLFSAIGTSWGTGDGSTTFNLPNCDSRFLEGTTDASKVGTYLEAGLPNITGSMSADAEILDMVLVSGAFTKGRSINNRLPYNGDGSCYYLGFDASLSNAFYGAASTVQPKSAHTLIIIKV